MTPDQPKSETTVVDLGDPISEEIARIVHAFPPGDSRRDDIRHLARRAFAQEAELRTLRARVVELERVNAWKVVDLETTVQNEHKLYADAHERMLQADARAESAEARAQEFERAFRNLVARIDGDGGHAQDGTSVDESLARADAAVVALQARVRELESALAELHEAVGRGPGHGTVKETLACALSGIADLRQAEHEATEESASFEKRIDELEEENDALTERLICPDCHDGGACTPGGCGIDDCKRCGRPCPTCGGSCDLDPAKRVARVKELEAKLGDVDEALMKRFRLGIEPIDGVVAFMRANWHNDGAEGEGVHKLCLYAETVPRLLARITDLESQLAAARSNSAQLSEELLAVGNELDAEIA